MSAKVDELIWQDCLERLQNGESLESVLARYPEQAAGLQPELEAAAWLLQRGPALAPRPGFVAASRRRLARRWLPAPRLTRSCQALVNWSLRLQARKLVVYAMLVILLVGQMLNVAKVARASQVFLPGEPLYPLKTVLENTHLLLAFDAGRQANLHIEYAQRRLLEVQALILEGDYAPIPDTVSRLDFHVNQTLRALNREVQRDPLQARRLGGELQVVLVSQAELVNVLAGLTPSDTQAECKRVGLIAQYGVLSARYMVSPNGRAPQGASPEALARGEKDAPFSEGARCAYMTHSVHMWRSLYI
ncbi:MAG: DUF5667 domain-containing protein [Chloroflexota bacterium]